MRLFLIGVLLSMIPAAGFCQSKVDSAALFQPDSNGVYVKTEISAAFPGGRNAWVAFLQHNLHAQVPNDKGAPEGTYTVIVQFIVNEDGSITDIRPLTSFGYGMENEVTRIIKKSGKWVAGLQGGHAVKSYEKQYVTFQVARG